MSDRQPNVRSIDFPDLARDCSHERATAILGPALIGCLRQCPGLVLSSALAVDEPPVAACCDTWADGTIDVRCVYQ